MFSFLTGIVGKFLASIPFTLIFVLLASIVWRGVGTAYGFRELAPDEEHAALVYLRRTLARLENDVRDARGPSALPLPE